MQQQKRLPNVPVTALLHDHFFAILFIFTGIFVVNYVLMNSAAAVFGITGIDLKFEDVSLLMDQVICLYSLPYSFHRLYISLSSMYSDIYPPIDKLTAFHQIHYFPH